MMQEMVTAAGPKRGTGEARMLDACGHRQPDCTPVWFMRQAGRCLAEYRAMRQKYGILEIAKTPELSAQVTLMPVDTFGVDAAVMFADIMIPLEGMGISLEIQQGGPVIHHPIRTMADVERLRVMEPPDVQPVLDAIRIVRRELSGKQAVIGFSGAPFTLASYLIEGGPSRTFEKAKGLMFGHPDVWDALLSLLADSMIVYLKAQIDAGAQVIQVFDSWVGALNPEDYKQYVLPHTRRIFAALKETGTPTIHFGTGNASLLELMAEAGGDLMSVDWRVNLDDAWARIGLDKGIQGNLDGTRLLAPWPAIEAGMRDVLARAGNRPGHIFNLGHGVMPETDPAMLARLVEAVHTATARG
jgi:uroporphyrinogen decarboxylase